MAKISARNSKEVARWVRHYFDSEGSSTTTLVLRSDGALLEKMTFRKVGEKPWSTNYTIRARRAKPLADLDRILAARGYTRER